MNLIKHGKNMVDQLGGYKNVFYRFLRECTVRVGTHVGTDKFGNKYYKNNSYFMGRNRFVEYPYKGRMEYDGTQIPPEWHAWMHYMTDDTPIINPPIVQKFARDHVTNMSGTKNAYIPYSTTKPKIEAWKPNQQ
nr:probable NADH dehydrogenase [ubiquinone] 1 alpha subcomplex subunit 12 [Hydra vulgaris]